MIIKINAVMLVTATALGFLAGVGFIYLTVIKGATPQPVQLEPQPHAPVIPPPHAPETRPAPPALVIPSPETRLAPPALVIPSP